MEKMYIDAVLSDIDNTVVQAGPNDEDIIPQAVIQAIHQTEDLGIPVLPVTGRSLVLMEGVHESIGFRHSGVLDGGASVYDFPTGEYVVRHLLEPDTVDALVGTLWPYATLLNYSAAYQPVNPQTAKGRIVPTEASPSVFAEYPIQNEDKLLKALGRIGVVVPEPMLTKKPGVRCLQFTVPGVSKLSGIRTLLEHEGLQTARLLAVGDNYNDKDLFVAAGTNGIKVPMGDAPAALRALANRPPVGTAAQEGAAYALRRYGIEPRQYGMNDQELRPAMEGDVRDVILARLRNKEPLANPEIMQELGELFAQREVLDPWQYVIAVTRALQTSDAQQLLWRDLDILRPASGAEHGGTVSGGMEEDYIRFFFSGPEEVRVILRFAAIFGDIGKILAVAATGQNFKQATYNNQVAANMLAGTDLPPCVKKAVTLMVGNDIVGGLLQGKEEAKTALSTLRKRWPKALASHLDDMLAALYLSDASAHSEYRMAINTRTGRFQKAVQPDDAQLTFLFERHQSGAVTLTPERCKLLAAHLPGLHYMRHLFVPGMQPDARPDPLPAEVFNDVIRHKLARHASAVSAHPHGSPYHEELRLEPQSILPLCPRAQFVQLTQKPESSDNSYNDVGPLVVFVPEHNGTIQHTFHIRDGRVWWRRIEYKPGNPGQQLASEVLPVQYTGLSTDAWTVGALQKILTSSGFEGSDFGAPLSIVDSWAVVQWLQQCALTPQSKH